MSKTLCPLSTLATGFSASKDSISYSPTVPTETRYARERDQGLSTGRISSMSPGGMVDWHPNSVRRQVKQLSPDCFANCGVYDCALLYFPTVSRHVEPISPRPAKGVM